MRSLNVAYWSVGAGAMSVNATVSQRQMPSAFKDLERENRELHKANEITKLVDAFFAQAELDRIKF